MPFVFRRTRARSSQAHRAGRALVLWMWFVGALSPGATGQEPPVTAEPTRTESWLDATPVKPWNQQGAAVPTAPAVEGESLTLGRCASEGRPPETPADRAVVAAGWTLVGPLQVFAETSVVTAATAADGMCRPLGFQGFVFVRGRFAGTISPVPMNARTEGFAASVRLLSRDRVMAEFVRYAPGDAMCCPSRITTVRYVVRRSPGGATLDVEQVVTRPAPAEP